MQVSDTSPVSLVCCDLVGTIAADGGILEKAFTEAIATQGVVPGTAAYARSMVQVDRARGYPPRDVMHTLFSEDDARAQAAYLAFERSYRAVVDRFGITTVPGVQETISKLSSAHVRVCLISGFSRVTSGHMLDRLGIRRQVDLTLCLDDVPRGWPWPDAVLTAVIRLGIGDVAEVAVVGDSENVLIAGHRAGAGTLVGLTGARTSERLRKAGATHLIWAVADLPELLLRASGSVAAEGNDIGREPPARDLPGYPHPGMVPSQIPFQGKHAGL
jgi:phosphoglycolate phosphatase